jgi:hypothetical protein
VESKIVVPRDVMTDAQIDAEIERSERWHERFPTVDAIGAKYLLDTDQIVVTYENGIEVRFPRSSTIRQLANASPEQIARVEVTHGVGLRWEEFDLDYYLPNMLECLGQSCRIEFELARVQRGARRSLPRTAGRRAKGRPRP